MRDEQNPMKNASGCNDPTAFKAIRNIERSEYKAYERVRALLKTIFYVCDLAGFKVDGRIVLVDKDSGRVWK